MTRGWICDSCGKCSTFTPWNCPGCQKEVCDYCFWIFGHCKPCCQGKSERELEEAANRYGFDFDLD